MDEMVSPEPTVAQLLGLPEPPEPQENPEDGGSEVPVLQEMPEQPVHQEQMEPQDTPDITEPTVFPE